MTSTATVGRPGNVSRLLEPAVPVLAIGLLFGYLGSVMGAANMFNTLFATAHDLLLNTVLFIMGICVLAGAVSQLLLEFGTVGVLEKLLKPLMRPLFRLPGQASLAGVMTFFSDNPAIIGLAHDKRFARSFKAFELVSLANFGTAFGMGLIVVTFMGTQNIGEQNALWPALVGVFGALIGSLVSTRLMQRFVRPILGDQEYTTGSDENALDQQDADKEESMGLRFLNACLDGGKTGVNLGLAIIPGVLIISTVVMVLTFGPGAQGYSGQAYEGVALLPELGRMLSGVFSLLFGFESPASDLALKTSIECAAVGISEIEFDAAGDQALLAYVAEHYPDSDEEPYLRFDSDLILQDGMVFSVEPGIYIPELGGFRHSDTAIITANGARSITTHGRDVESLIIG